MKMSKRKEERVKVQLSWLDLENMREMCKCILKTNIAVKKFQMRFAPDIEAENIMNESIYNSQKGLEKVEKLENVESINAIIFEGAKEKNWVTFLHVLNCFSGTLNDDSFYEFDKYLSDYKKEQGEA